MQAYAFAALVNNRLKRSRGEMMSLMAMAMRGDPKELRKLIRKMSDE